MVCAAAYGLQVYGAGRYTSSVMDNQQGYSPAGLGTLLGDRQIAVAESCTGGALAARLVSVPGSSAYFRGGVIAYSNDVKAGLLGVKEAVLASHGAVSEECALQMARGVRRLLGTHIAISTTGIAGPEGGTPQKPVGLVYVALSTPEGETVTRNVWSGDRMKNIELSVQEGLRLLREYLEGTGS